MSKKGYKPLNVLVEEKKLEQFKDTISKNETIQDVVEEMLTKRIEDKKKGKNI